MGRRPNRRRRSVAQRWHPKFEIQTPKFFRLMCIYTSTIANLSNWFCEVQKWRRHKGHSITDFQDVAVWTLRYVFQPILLFEREEQANDNQKQNRVTFSAWSGGKLKHQFFFCVFCAFLRLFALLRALLASSPRRSAETAITAVRTTTDRPPSFSALVRQKRVQP